MHNDELIGTGPAGDEHPDEFASNDQSDVAADPPEVVIAHPDPARDADLEGDMGVSSERTAEDADSDDVESTGSVGSATTGTDGSNPTVGGTAHSENDESSNPADVPSHESDPAKNPGHSHG